MDTKHTPGPWRVCSGFIKPYYPGDALIVGVNDRASDVAWVPCRFEDMPEMESRQIANARLIAAAPELLEALEEMIELASPNIYPQPDKSQSGWAKLQRARAAIAKAKGGDA